MHGASRLLVEIDPRRGLAVAGCPIYFGYINFLRVRQLSAAFEHADCLVYAAIPLCGVLVAPFTIEQIVNGCRNGFDHPEPPEEPGAIPPLAAAVPEGDAA